MEYRAKITSKGQTTIPAELRAELELKPGDRIAFVQRADGSFTIKKDTASISDLKGLIKLEKTPTQDQINDWIDVARRAIGSP
jgi:AbrB family looped-hinge helix DNA binding protein